MQPAVKADLREIWQAETRAAAETAMDTFSAKYGAKYEKAVTCLTKDRDALLAFYGSPTVRRAYAAPPGPRSRLTAANDPPDRLSPCGEPARPPG